MFNYFKKFDNKITREELKYEIDNLQKWELDGMKSDIKNLTQLLSMLVTELGYSASLGRHEVVQLNKKKK